MNALLKLIANVEDAKILLKLAESKELKIVHATHEDVFLTEAVIRDGGFTTNFGGYGSRSGLGFNAFNQTWKFVGVTDPRGKSFAGLKLYLSINENLDSSIGRIEELKDAIIKSGGEMSKTSASADIIVTKAPSIFKGKKRDDALLVDYSLLQNALPKPRSSDGAPIGRRFSGDTVSLWKLLSVRDIPSINQGLELAATLPDEIDALIDGCIVNQAGELIRSKRFSGSGPALSFLDCALLGLLSIAPRESEAGKLRSAIKKLDISIAEIPILREFCSLEKLSLRIPQDSRLIKKDLSNLGLLPELLTLEISSTGYQNNVLESLNGLNAPKLEELSASRIGLVDISGLRGLVRLKSVDLSSNADLETIDGLTDSAKSLESLLLGYCQKLKSLDSLNGANKLKRLNLDNCKQIKSLRPLAECRALESFSVSNLPLRSLEGLDEVMIENAQVRYSFKVKKAAKLSELVNLTPRIDATQFEISQFSIQKD